MSDKPQSLISQVGPHLHKAASPGEAVFWALREVPPAPNCTCDNYRQRVEQRDGECKLFSETAPVPDGNGSSPYKLPELRWDPPQAAEPE